MKELSIEEKVKRYDEALHKAKNYYSTTDSSSDIKLIGLIFPELKESEDERIRKEMISWLKGFIGEEEGCGYTEDEIKERIAWLEKQGEHANFRNKIQIGDKVTRNEDGVLVNLSQLNRVAKKQGEQKPTDKVEPKFKIGDWVIDKQGIVHQIANVIENVTNHTYSYDIVGGGYFNDNTEGVRLWTIRDAKDGTVLVASDGSIFLFKDRVYSACKYYIALTTDGAVKFNNDGLEHYWETVTAVHPATKEQRDTLIKAMADAGYAFDFEKKELKKIADVRTTGYWHVEDIEQEPTEWSEEKEIIL